MTLPTTDHIAELSHAELVALVKALIAAVQRLEAENQQLKAEVGKESLPPSNVAELLAAAVTGCEAQSGSDAETQEAWAAVWACAPDAGMGGGAGPEY